LHRRDRKRRGLAPAAALAPRAAALVAASSSAAKRSPFSPWHMRGSTPFPSHLNCRPLHCAFIECCTPISEQRARTTPDISTAAIASYTRHVRQPSISRLPPRIESSAQLAELTFPEAPSPAWAAHPPSLADVSAVALASFTPPTQPNGLRGARTCMLRTSPTPVLMSAPPPSPAPLNSHPAHATPPLKPSTQGAPAPAC
jgi:hypothetical protein